MVHTTPIVFDPLARLRVSSQQLAVQYYKKLDLQLKGQIRLEKEYTTDQGTTQLQIFGPNQKRIWAVFVCLHATQTVNIWVDSTVTTTKGIRLGAAGGIRNMIFPEDEYIMTQPWHGIGSGASTSFFAAAYEVYE